ncbi:hypothetical protein DSECCO2_483290 [anaerobic digester metagenome]
MKTSGLLIHLHFKNAPVEGILDPEVPLFPQSIHLLRKGRDRSFTLRLNQQPDDTGDWKAVEPRDATPLGLVEEEHIGPDLESKGDALRFASRQIGDLPDRELFTVPVA